MKRKNFYLSVLSLLVMSACSDETTPLGDFTENGNKEVITFVFPGTAQGVVPYAATASLEENAIETLDAYVFGTDPLVATNAPYLLENVFKLTEGNGLTTAGEDRTAALTIIGANDKKIYFVANGRTEATLDDYELGVTKITDFEQKQTALMGKGLIKCPLLMTGDYTVVRDGEGKVPATPIDVTLTRRVARFDVINNSDESTFKIEKILIKKARPGAFIFPLLTGQTYTEAVVAELMEIDFLSFNNANVAETSSVFYLYPTVVDGETSFDFKGISTQSGEKMVQPVLMRQKQSGTEAETKLLPINANSRYVINMLATGSATINASISVKEWVVGEQVDVEAGFGKVKMTLPATGTPEGVTLTESKKLSLPAIATAAAFDILVAADTEWALEAHTIGWITTSNTPASGEVGKKFSLAATANPSTTAREAILYIRNVKRPAIVQALTVVQAGNAAGFSIAGNKLVNNTVQLFGSVDSETLTIGLPEGATEFTHQASDSWITLATTDARATTTKTLEVTVAANTTDAEREGTITITVGELTQTIAVKQAARNLGGIAVQAVGLANGLLNYEGSAQADLKLLVRALTAWEVTAFDIDAEGVVTTIASDWITGAIELKDQETTPANYDGSYNFTVAANATGVARKSVVSVVNTIDASIKFEITVTQAVAAAVAPTFTVTGKDLADNALPFANTEIGVTTYTVAPTGAEVSALTVVKSGDASDWLTLVDTDLTTAGTFTLAATANTAAEARTATITVTLDGADAPQVITVTQAAAAAVAPTFTVTGEGLAGNALPFANTEIGATTYTVAPTGAEVSALTVVKSGDASDWLTLVDTDLTTAGTFTLAATANTAAEARTATITVTLDGADAPQVITVTQAAAAGV